MVQICVENGARRALPADLSDLEIACLLDMAQGPLSLCDRWLAQGERKKFFFYQRAGGDLEHQARILIWLGQRGWAQFEAPDYEKCVLTPAGVKAVADLKSRAEAQTQVAAAG